MKKFFLIFASLVLGFGQLFADQVTFSLADLRATLPSGNTNVEVPYTWKVSPYHVSVTIAKKDGTTGTLAIANTTTLTNYTLTVNIAGAGSLDGATISTNPAPQAGNITASNGSYASGTWTPTESGVTSVTFTPNNTFRMTQISVDYTPDSGYNPDVPADGFTEPFEATPVDNLASYSGNDPYVYDKTALKFYALNSLGEYEEYGIVTEVNTLKVAGNAITEIEYIKSPSNAYINLNYIPKANTKAVCTLVAETGGAWKAAYGCGYYQNGWKDRFCFFTTNATINLGGETGNSEAMRYGEKIVTVLDAVSGKMDIFEADGTTLIGTINDSPKTADCKTPLYVFAQNKDVPGGGTQTDCYNPFMTLYGLQLYESETLVMDLVPAINGEGKGGLKDKLTGTFYGSANNAEFELSADGQAMAGEAGITAYEGKIVIYNNHEYEYFNGSWVDRGEMAYKAVPEIGTDYKNLSNWSYPSSDYDATFGVNVFDGTTNTLNPYEGKGGWEPLSYKLTGLEKGESYRFSFVYTGTAWHSWSSYTTLPFVIWDAEGVPDRNSASTDGSLAYVLLPNTAVSNQAYSRIFTAGHNYATLCIQFGVCDDGAHDPAFAFSFGNINIEKRILPKAYNKIDWADPVKYTALEYIEAISQARENAFTLPYIPITATQIDTKFQVYDTSTGWCGIFSARNVYAGTGISLYMNGNDRAHFGYFTGSTGGAGDNFAPFSLNTDYEVQADVTKLVVNGETYETGNIVTNATTRQLSLFANPEWDNPMRGRFYYCNISEAGETVYNFKPVMRHDGVFGFYDKASRVFVLPARGTLDGYGYKKLDDQAYMTFTNETRLVIAGTTAQFLPDIQNIPSAMFSWKSSDETIATVAPDGTVTGVKAGKVTITVTATYEDWTASYELTVAEPEFKRFDANNVGYAIVTGGNGWGDSPVANLLDNNANTKFGCSSTDESWAIMMASEPVAVSEYTIVTGADTYNYPGRNPVSWMLQASNDNQNWILLDEKVQTYQLQAKNKEAFTFYIDGGAETYKFFKFSATEIYDGFQIAEFWINGQAHNFAEATDQRVEATCTKEGKVVYECDDCHALEVKPIFVLDHTFANGVCTTCGAKAAEITLLPTRGDDNTPYYAKFRHAAGVSDDESVDIAEGWANADFDDSAWDELMMPLGSFGPIHTPWYGDYNTFWFRRHFFVENPATITSLTFKAVHDDDCAVFLNGEKIWNEFGWTGGENDWRNVEVDPSLLVAGDNVLAVYVEQNWGGAYCDFGLFATCGATIEVTDAGYATFVAPCDVDFTGADVTPNAVKFDGEYIRLAPVTNVPAGTAVVVKAEEGTYTVPKTTDAILGATNELVAATADVVADGTQYILAKKDEKVGFRKATSSSTIAAGKGYLVLGEAGVKAFYPFADEDPTGINGVKLAGDNAPIYNVAGQRLNKIQKGINIVNGKKILK